MRKFGSSPQLPSDPEPSSKENKTLRPDFGHRTLPNHYISDHQLVADMAGRTMVTSSPNTLIIGGVPFHIRQHSQGGVARYNLPAPPGSNQGVERSVIYPVYETIESDYSEMSSVYSDRDTSGSTMYTQCTSGSTVYTDMSGVNYILANQTILGNQTAYQKPEAGNQPRLVDGSVLQFAGPGPEVSGYPGLRDEMTQSAPRFQPLQQRPVLRNLPAAARSQSFRTRAPLPPVPRVQLLQSTISLENNPTATPVSNL